MKYEIVVFRNFHFRRNEFLTPASYRVPEDVSEEIAQRCIKAGAAKRVDRMKLKGPAPENKLAAAPETKDDPIKKKAPIGPDKSSLSRPRGRPKGSKTST